MGTTTVYILIPTNTTNAAGGGYWTCPTGVSSITVSCWGGGGGGATNGAGGGGGAFASGTVSVTAGTTYAIQVGSGGTAGATGTAGTATWFQASTTINANGGSGGGSTTGGAGGTAGATGTTHNAGGAGASKASGGGGGGAGGPDGTGSTATTATGGSGDNGSGGAGGTTGVAGSTDLDHGGGGGGGKASASPGKGGFPGGGGGGGTASGITGGQGSDGLIKITYTGTTQTIYVIQNSNNVPDITGSWLCPSNVTTVTAQCWGGGGGGSATGGQGGGGGTAYASGTVSVTAGNSYNWQVGTGGNAGSTPGGTTWFSSSTTVAAVGGGSTSTSTAGTGGAAASCHGTTTFSGGNGSTTGGGGGAAGPDGAGGNASGTTGGTADNGSGGAGGTSGNQGSHNQLLGGGGSGNATTHGGGYFGGGGAAGGGGGASGQLILTYSNLVIQALQGTVTSNNLAYPDLSFSDCKINVGSSPSAVGQIDFSPESANHAYSMEFPYGDVNYVRFEVHHGDKWSGDGSNTRDRSELDGFNTQWATGTYINVTYEFMADSSCSASTAGFMVIGQLHQTGSSGFSPVYELDLISSDKMTVFINNASNTDPQVYQDSSAITRGHWYKMEIYTLLDNSAGFVRIRRDNIKILDYSGNLGWSGMGNVYWKYGIYRDQTDTSTQIVHYRNLKIYTGNAARLTANMSAEISQSKSNGSPLALISSALETTSNSSGSYSRTAYLATKAKTSTSVNSLPHGNTSISSKALSASRWQDTIAGTTKISGTVISHPAFQTNQASWKLAIPNANVRSNTSLKTNQGSWSLSIPYASVKTNAFLKTNQASWKLSVPSSSVRANTSLFTNQGSFSLVVPGASVTSNTPLKGGQTPFSILSAASRTNAPLKTNQGSWKLAIPNGSVNTNTLLKTNQGSFKLAVPSVLARSNTLLKTNQGSFKLAVPSASLNSTTSLKTNQGSWKLALKGTSTSTFEGEAASAGKAAVYGTALSIVRSNANSNTFLLKFVASILSSKLNGITNAGSFLMQMVGATILSQTKMIGPSTLQPPIIFNLLGKVTSNAVAWGLVGIGTAALKSTTLFNTRGSWDSPGTLFTAKFFPSSARSNASILSTIKGAASKINGRALSKSQSTSVTSGTTKIAGKGSTTSSSLSKFTINLGLAFSGSVLSKLSAINSIGTGYRLVGKILSSSTTKSSATGTANMAALTGAQSSIKNSIKILMPIFAAAISPSTSRVVAAANLLGRTVSTFISNNTPFQKASLSGHTSTFGSSKNTPLYSLFLSLSGFYKNSAFGTPSKRAILFGKINSTSGGIFNVGITFRALAGTIKSVSRLYAPIRIGNFLFTGVGRSNFFLFGKGPVYRTAQLHSNVLTLTKTSTAPSYRTRIKSITRSIGFGRSRINATSALSAHVSTNTTGIGIGIRQLLKATASFISTLRNRATMYFTNPNYIDYKSNLKNPWNLVLFGTEMPLPPKDPTETVIVTFDFSPVLANGEAIESIVGVSSTLFYGTDTNPSALIATAPLIVNTYQMVQPVSGGIDQNTYKIKATVTTNMNQTLTITAILYVVAQ